MKKQNKQEITNDLNEMVNDPSATLEVKRNEAQEGNKQVIELDFSGAKVWEEDDEESQHFISHEENEEVEDKPNVTRPMQQQKPSFILTGEDLLKLNIGGLPYLVEPIIPLTGVVALAGSSDTGKSSFLRQLGLEIVTGESHFLGFPIKSRFKNVIYVSTEDDANAISFLLQKQLGDKPRPETYRNLRYIFDTDNIFKKLEEALKAQPADCVIIDTFTDMYGDDMNSTSKIRNFINGFTVLASRYDCLFIFNHHTGKRTEQKPPSKDNLLGSQGFEAKMRLVIELRKDMNDPAVRHLCIVKGNYIPGGEKDASYALEFDAQMRYKNLNRRVKYIDLAKPVQEKTEVIEAKAIAVNLHNKGMSTREISEELKKQGYDFGKSTVAEWVKGSPVVQKGKGTRKAGQQSANTVVEKKDDLVENSDDSKSSEEK